MTTSSVACRPDTGEAGAAGAVDDGEAHLVEIAAEGTEEMIRVWSVDGSHEDNTGVRGSVTSNVQ
jgi:hypothetical protein